MDRNPAATVIVVMYACLMIGACSRASKPYAATAAAASADGAETDARPLHALPPMSAQCPASNFRDFLEAFAGDAATRERYTADPIDVVDWKDVDETELGTHVVPTARASYRGFTLTYRDGRFHHVAADGSVDPASETPRIEPSGDGFDVRYVYGMSEGNSWHFAERNGCWLMTSDPEPSVP